MIQQEIVPIVQLLTQLLDPRDLQLLQVRI
jgi:hypothetical protein